MYNSTCRLCLCVCVLVCVCLCVGMCVLVRVFGCVCLHLIEFGWITCITLCFCLFITKRILCCLLMGYNYAQANWIWIFWSWGFGESGDESWTRVECFGAMLSCVNWVVLFVRSFQSFSKKSAKQYASLNCSLYIHYLSIIKT